jgi:hypothetical protein
VLDVKAGSRRRGARAIIWPNRGQANQRWTYDATTGRLSPCHAPLMALDVKGAHAAEGTPAIVWPFKVPAEANQVGERL